MKRLRYGAVMQIQTPAASVALMEEETENGSYRWW
jgi:hypothetical protein